MDIVGWLNFGLTKGSRIPRPPWNMAQFELGSEAQWTKWLPRSIFYRWYDQWTLSKLVKVQQSSKWGKFNSAQIKAVGGRSSPRFEGCTKLRIVHDGFLWCHASYDRWIYGISFFAINCTINIRHFDTSWNRIQTQKRPTARHRVAGCLLLRSAYFRIERSS